MNVPFQFQKDFLLGVATASTQIEGGDTNNSWYQFTKDGTHTADHTNSLRANNHYQNYVEDIKLLKEMGIQIYRFSIEWSRIEPEEGVFSKEGMDHYLEEIKLLNLHGIKPLITLHHFSNPLWFENSGAFLRKDAVEVFSKYVEFVVKSIGDLADEYCTINEPNVYALNCYFTGQWCQQHTSFKETIKVLSTLGAAHIASYKIIKSINPNAKVGFANHIIILEPKSKYNLFYKFEAHMFSKIFQDSIMKAMATGKFSWPLKYKNDKGKYYDFIGINYYQRSIVAHFKYGPSKDAPHNDLGWDIYPSGIKMAAEKYHKLYPCDVYITENGTADKHDAFRSQYLYDHLYQLKDLSYVKRYYEWTFMDNFEWAEGESAKFGLVEYNYETGEKKIRQSGKFYTEMINNGGITQELINKYLK